MTSREYLFSPIPSVADLRQARAKRERQRRAAEHEAKASEARAIKTPSQRIDRSKVRLTQARQQHGSC
jgi:hypothetical protein